MKLAKAFLLILLIVPLSGFRLEMSLSAQSVVSDPPFSIMASPWADSVYQTLSDEQKIAQLFMVAAYSNKDKAHLESLEKLVADYDIGGLIFFQGGPVRQAKMTNHLQAMAKVPLFIAIDGEWGLAMRLDSTVKYPWQMTLGAIRNDELIYEMGKDISDQFNRLGIHINFAPVVDVNVNPSNPVINARSFGENREEVARKGTAYMKGLQYHYVLANAKHFPGHGDTDKDSHKTLPVINHTRSRLDSIELYPFKQLIDQGLSSAMVAHLYVPAYVKEFNEATTLSKEVVTGLLQDSLGFKGLIFTDALNMKGVSERYAPGIVDVKALLAGNDVLLFAEDVPRAISEIKKAIRNEEISMEEIGKRCLKILRAKEWAGLSRYEPVKIKGLYEDLNKPAYEVLNRQLTAESITLIRNANNILPLQRLDTLRIASLTIGEENSGTFTTYLQQYAAVKLFHLPEGSTPQQQKLLMDSLDKYNFLVVSIHKSNVSPFKSYAISSETKDLLNTLRIRKRLILDVFANPYSLKGFDSLEKIDGVIMSYQNSEAAQQLSAELIFGGIPAKGMLPVSLSPAFPAGHGLTTGDPIRLNYRLPESQGIDSRDLAGIDSLAIRGIREKAFPGCQVLVAREGQVIYQKSFGYHTYEGVRPVRNSDLYDLASITKIASTLLAVMKLVDEGKINLDEYLCTYLPELVDTTEYANLTLREILAHQAGLPAWIPFYKKTLISGMPRYDVYSLVPSDLYCNRVAENLYINKHYNDTIMRMIVSTKLNKKREYLYSDIGYYFLMRIVEKTSGQSLDQYVDDNFYAPMGMANLGYSPRGRIPLDRIVPTENDKLFRRQQIHGDVHDPGAAMLGGVGGHAGLFSDANDLAKLMQMYLDSGTYGGVQYISDSIVNDFTRCQYCEDDNRRGAGFDKPVRDGGAGPTCSCVSFASFGHSGFTGTLAWADPEKKIVYIFLSNRVYPDAGNKKLVELGTRTAIQQVIYDAVGIAESKSQYVEK